MLYTQHPSNTRTTVTIVMSIIFGISSIPTTALGNSLGAQQSDKKALYFSLENADAPTLYQEVRVKVRKATAVGGVVGAAETTPDSLEATDKIYFIETSNKCKDAPSSCTDGKQDKCTVVPPAGVTPWSVVKSSGEDKDSVVATVIIKNPEFKLGSKYKLCYIKKKAEVTDDGLYEASHTSTDKDQAETEFTVLDSIYTKYEMTPATVYSGQGPVQLIITAKAATTAKTIAQPAYLIPCPNAGCTNGAFTPKDKGDITALCSKTSTNQNAIATAVVTGFGTVRLTTTFSVPVTLVTTAASYGLCVPYCSKSAKADSCEESLISWALVNSDPPITFQPANPLSYTISPGSPTTLTFTGTGLKAGDKIRILTKGEVPRGGLCPISFTTQPSTMEYTDEITAVATCPTGGPTFTQTKFRISTPLTTAVPGQVCYSRDGTSVWAPVPQAAVKTALYFSLENADAPTLYQEVRVKIEKDTATCNAVGEGVKDLFVNFEATDEFFFFKTHTGTAQTAVNEATNPCRVTSGTPWTAPEGVKVRGVQLGDGSTVGTAITTVFINKAEFNVGDTYKICYIKYTKKAGHGGVDKSVSPKLYETSYRLTSGVQAKQVQSFTVLSSIYTSYAIEPIDVYAGQGPVTLTITVASGRAIVNKGITQLPYLIPCTGDDCSTKTTGDLSETDIDKYASLCSLNNKQGAVTAVAASDFRKAAKITTTFIAPITPAAFYVVCVPYCSKPNGDSCATDSTVSWALVDSVTPIRFKAANPSSYTISPGSPTTLTFTGTGLNAGDKIRILTKEQVGEGLCKFSATTGTEYTAVATCPTGGPTFTQTKFRISTPLTTAVPGQVCYSRDGTSVWAPVPQAAVKTALYFSLENADAPTLYQEVRVKVRRATTDANCKDPVFAPKDKVYFIEKAAAGGVVKCTNGKPTCVVGGQCTVTPPSRLTLWDMVPATGVGADVTSAVATVIIKNADFSADKAYKMCYLKKGEGTTGSVYSAVYEASYTSTDISTTAAEFTVLSSIYTTHVTEPTDVHAGTESVKLTITNPARTTGKTFGRAPVPTVPYLIPCKSDCSDKDKYAALCSKDNDGAVTTAVVSGLATGILKTTFTAPKSAAAYGVCVPYCFKADSCKGSTVSWALVNSVTPIKILAAKPADEPNLPQTKKKTEVPIDTDSKKTVTPVDGQNTKDTPPVPVVNKSTTLSATAISSTIPAVLITSVVFLYLYNW